MSGSVLLVEDEENLASLVRAYLEQEGYRVISAVTGAEALRAVERSRCGSSCSTSTCRTWTGSTSAGRSGPARPCPS